MRALLNVALVIAILAFLFMTFTIYTNYKLKKERDENRITNMERDLLRKEDL